jgi:hypothetical protein
MPERNHSKAAKKGWATRRANEEFLRRSQAAKKGWATRKARAYTIISKNPLTLQFPPMVRKIRMKRPILLDENGQAVLSETRTTFELAFPYTIFQFTPELGIYFTNEPFNEKTKLCHVPLPHINGQGMVCMPNSIAYDVGNSEEAVVSFLHSDFIEKYYVQCAFVSNTKLRTYKKWERLTKEASRRNGLGFITEVNWEEVSSFLEMKVKNCLGKKWRKANEWTL